ncbi:MAG TPA: HlyD family type I secretion periplasmic adaptor subunit [Xanthobacteraceae bacterium]|nr:HlyD family type I secretion periplasmic adaptor subunit [Xanthobacteraceae bacterium]
MSAQRLLPPQDSIRRHLLTGGVVVLLLVGGIGGLAATTQFAGAVIAQGQLVVDTSVKKVQHPTGGVVAKLFVREGAHVKAGETLVRLDDTQTRANLGVINAALDEAVARAARDEAERDGAKDISFPPELLARQDDPKVARLIGGERKLFNTRRETREGQKAQLNARIAQLREEISGNEASQQAKDQQIEWVNKELQGVRSLWAKELVPFVRIATLERQAAELAGERGQTIATVAQLKGKISEIELQILQIDQDMRTEVSKELSDMRAKISEYSEKKIAAEDSLNRIEIRSPQEGVVLQLAVHTAGEVIAPGEQIMLIVPEAEALTVEVKINPQDIDQVQLGQPATVRFLSFNWRTTPEINGTVSRISADVTQDPKTGVYFYTVRIAIPQAEISKLGDVKLIPGMPVEAFMQTGERTVLSYLTKPLHDQLMRAFREK